MPCAGNEAFEKLGTWGTSSNLIVYLTTVFNMKRANAAVLINAFTGTSFFSPLIGGFLADAYKTLGFASIASLLGMILLMLTAAISKLHPPNCGTQKNDLCEQATKLQWTFIFNPKIDTGKRSIISFANWYFFVLSSSTLISLTLIVYVQSNVSWTINENILNSIHVYIIIACILFFMGSRIYVKVKPEGSPLTRFVQVIVAATRKRCLAQPDNLEISLFNCMHPNSINSKLQHTDQFDRFFDKAAILSDTDQIKDDATSTDPWRLCNMQQVEELKCVIRVLPLRVSGAIFYITVPSASYIVFSWLSIVIWIPIYDCLIVPQLSKLTGKEGGITLLQRMGIETFISIITMLVSALAEQRRHNSSLTYPTLSIAKGGGAISSVFKLVNPPALN
ncbi:hypothetical protein C5167_006021 [Papaver somniferum]|uniref:Uncharacterized protein n=1 Tax=Papaver somniferum TaxID=3469 RepID=A0A4Y7JGE5_PAPSO|nr:hypothetical protein C5167_006021 [Papaver somniferum]